MSKKKRVLYIIGIIVIFAAGVLIFKISGEEEGVMKLDVDNPGVKINISNPPSEKVYKDEKGIKDAIEDGEILEMDWEDEEGFILLNVLEDDLGYKHYKYNQTYKEVKVYGAEVIVHLNDKGKIYSINGKVYPHVSGTKVKKESVIDEKELKKGIRKGIEKKCTWIKLQEYELMIYPIDSSYKLVYRAEVQCGLSYDGLYVVFADAYSGEVYSYYNNIQTKE